MLPFSNPEIFKNNPSVVSEHRIRAEWNFNEIVFIEDYGCYTTTTNNLYNPVRTVGSDTYSYYQQNTNYDFGRSQIFFEGLAKQGICSSASSGATSITLSTNPGGLTVGMRVEGNSIPADTYVTSVNSNTIGLSKGLSKAISSAEDIDFYNYDQDFDKDRINYTPLASIFDRNRPDPGIVNLVSNTRYGSAILDLEKLKVANFGNTNGTTREDRIYPMYKYSSFRYWNSIRKILKDYVPETVGASEASGSGGIYKIEYAAPFIVYAQSFYTNKVVVKTQKYSGNYPTRFTIDVLEGENPEYSPGESSNWVSIYTGTTTDLQDGVLEIYYDGTSWSGTPQYLTEFIGNPTKAKKIHGIRLSITGMSKGNIGAEVIELSPRLSTDITSYVLGFDKISTLNNTSYGIPVAGLVSSTGSLKISNIDMIFSSRNPNSILSDLLYEGTEMVFEQLVDISGTKTAIPLGTLYAISWSENSDFTTNVELEDYLYFLKSQKAPDIVIANTTGIEASTAILILLDNAGVTNYKFVKREQNSNLDDFVFDYFYSSKDLTVANVLENIANSAQYAIFVDANNVINAVTKEKFSDVVSAANTDYWLVGSEGWTGQDEATHLNNNYIANFASINESETQPLTQATISYAGNDIYKNATAILKTNENPTKEINYLFNASLVNTNYQLGITALWDIDSGVPDNEKSLLAMAYINDISATRPSILTNALTTPIVGNDENDVARYVYNNATDKSYFQILTDPEYGTLFLEKGQYEGYVLIDSELIKFRGLIISAFDDKDPTKSGTVVVFDQNEFAEIKSRISSGSSLLCRGLMVDLNFQISDISDIFTNGVRDYLFISDGRGSQNTNVLAHKAQTDSEMLQRPFTTKLYASSFNARMKATGTMVAKSEKLKSAKLNESVRKQFVSYPGYLKISGPKEDWKKDQDAKLGDLSDKEEKLPVDNFGERFITGFHQPLTFVPERISTRMRLLAKPQKQVFASDYSEETRDKYFMNRGIAGICFKVNVTSSGTSGYFLEVEDVGNITNDQLEAANFDNVRLYRVSRNTFKPKLLGSAWVNTNAVAGESLDMDQLNNNSGKSYATTSDLVITIEETKKNFIYRVFWEEKKIMTVKESKEKAINRKSNNIGLFVRSNSEAMFEHLMAASVSRNGRYPVSTIFSKNSPYMNLQGAVDRGLLPPGFSEGLVGSKDTKFYMEDFGRLLRQVNKYSVKFDTPVVYSYPFDLGRINTAYHVAGYSSSSYGADFWVFNTSNSNINLSTSNSLPLIISGVAINRIKPGNTTLSEYIEKRLGEDNEKATLLEKNLRKFGNNNINISGEYINSLPQAESILNWVLQNSLTPKKTVTGEIFPNPLLEIGDKIRIFYPELGYSKAQQGDRVYYVHSISYSVDNTGPKMNISVREV